MRLIYLHGFASGPSSKKARFFADRFAESGVTVEVPDLTEGNFETLTITGQLRAIEKLARGEAVCLMGSSLGGYLAALYAARHPEVERIVLLAPAFGFARRWPQRLGEEKVAAWRRSGWLEVYHYADQCERRVSYQLLADGAQYEDYPAVPQPVLVFHGRHDDIVPCDLSVEFAARHPQARLELLDSDHELLDVLDSMWEKARAFLLPASTAPAE